MADIQVQTAAGTLNPGDAGVWTGNEPIPGVFEVRAITTDGERAHCVMLTPATSTAPGFARCVVDPIPRLFAAAASPVDRLAETSAGLRPAQPGEAITAIALQSAMPGEIKLVAQLLAALPRRRLWTSRAGTGAMEAIPHNLGGVPDRVEISVESDPGTAYTVQQGTHTATDILVNVSVGVAYRVFADRLG